MQAHARRVSEVMEREVVSLGRDDRLDLVEDIMRLGRIRHMPVLEGGRVVGIVSARDLLAASLSKAFEFEGPQRRAFLRAVQVEEVMSEKLVTIAPEASLAEAASSMLRHRVGALPVVASDATLLGLLTETDLVRTAYLAGQDAADADVEEIEMSEEAGRLEEELEHLRRMRDELRVKLHLAKAEAKDAWEGLEEKFRAAESKAKRVARASEEPLHDVAEAARALLREVRDGYHRIRDAL